MLRNRQQKQTNHYPTPANIITTKKLIFVKLWPERSEYINFLNHYIQKIKKEIDSEASVTAQKNINVQYLNALKFKLPPLAEQQAIVREIESRLSVCDKVEQNISESLEKAEALWQSILKKAFEGKPLSGAEIARCRQEADYEPASVLLERIRKEKKHEK